MREILFIVFGLFTLGCALGVVFSKSPVYSAFSLILCFFGLSALYVLWGSTFIAMVQVLIYTGAIVVLFVFVVMLLNLVRSTPPPSYSWLTLTITGAAVWLLSLFLLRTLNQTTLFTKAAGPLSNELRTISRLLFTQYLWPFEVLSVFLLALIVAIFSLSRPDEESEVDS